MAREIKDEIQTGSDSPLDQFSSMTPQNGIQIPTSEALERTFVSIVKEDYEASKSARDKKDYGITSKGEKLNFEKWFKSLQDLYNSRREAKTVPWKFCANRSLRIAKAILDVLHARMFPVIYNEDLTKWKPQNWLDAMKADRITKLMSWWIFVHSRMRAFFDVWVKVILGYGDGLTETTWKVEYVDTGKMEESVNQQPIVGPDGAQLINPDGTPAVSEQTVQTRVIEPIETSISHTYLKDQYFLQENSTDVTREPVVIEETYLYRDLEQGELEGKFVNVTNLLKEKLPYEKPTQAGLSDAEKESIRNIKLRNVQVNVLKWYGNYDADGDGFAEDIRVMISPEYNVYLSGIPVNKLTKSGKRPLDFTKADNRIDRPYENDGEGVLETIKELAEEIDAIFNQLTDANTLSVLRPGFYDPQGDIDAPSLTIGPNKLIPVADPTKGVYFPDFNVNVERLIAAIRLVLEFIERLTAASSYVMGKESEIVGGSGTATRTNAIMQSASERFQVPAERMREGAARIMKQHLDILQLNIPPGLENRILGEDNKPIFEANELSAEGISGEFDCYLLPDPAMGSVSAERELASMFYSILLQNPIVVTNPAKLYKVTYDLIKAYGKEPEQYLGPAPADDMIDDPNDENTLIIQGDFEQVIPTLTENHMLHIQKHMELMQSPNLAALPPHLATQISQFTQQHIMQHQQMMQMMLSIMQKFGGGKGGAVTDGGKQGESMGGPEGPGQSSRVEATSGPLAGAMQTKREGESGQAPY